MRARCGIRPIRRWPNHQADALRLPVRTGSADGVTCGFALRNFVELDPFFGIGWSGSTTPQSSWIAEALSRPHWTSWVR